MLWSIWATLGVVMIVFEIISPTFFTLFVGIGFLVSAMMSYIFPEALLLQVFFASLGVIVAVIIFKKRKIGDDLSVQAGQSSEYKGVKGTVFKSIHFAHEGVVVLDEPMLGESQWQAKSVSNEDISEGSRVEVIALHGQSLIVTSI